MYILHIIHTSFDFGVDKLGVDDSGVNEFKSRHSGVDKFGVDDL